MFVSNARTKATQSSDSVVKNKSLSYMTKQNRATPKDLMLAANVTEKLLRLVFTSDVVGVGIVSRVVRALMT